VKIFKGDSVKPFTGGTFIQQPIQYAPLKAGPFAPGSTFDISYIQTDTAMQFNLKQYYANVTVQANQMMLNRGDEAKMNFVEEKLINGQQALAAALATDMYNDGQGQVSSVIALDGLLAAYDDGTNYPSYGGLPRAAIGTGANNGINGYYQNVAGLISLTTLQKAYGQATFGNEQPNFISTTQIVYNAVWAKLQPAQRVMDETSDIFSAGFTSIRFNNKQFAVDQYVPAGYVFGMNTNFINLYVAADPLFGFGFTGFKELPNSVDTSGQLCFGGNMVVSAPRLGFILAGITG
jgi:hypothetical protein